MKTRLAITIVLIGLMLSGCASARMCYNHRVNETDTSSAAKKGNLFTKDRDIKGKGVDIFVYGDIDTKVTLPDGTIIEVKTIKPSMFERMFGWMYILKPDNVGVGKWITLKEKEDGPSIRSKRNN